MDCYLKRAALAAVLNLALCAYAQEGAEAQSAKPSVLPAASQAASKPSTSAATKSEAKPLALAEAIHAASTPSSLPATTKAETKPQVSSSAASATAQGRASDSNSSTGAGKFVQRSGTGASKPVRTAPPVTLPDGPLGKDPGDISKLIVEAQKAGGVAIDPIQKEMNLPGLKKDDPSLKPFVLQTRNGVNEIVRMSGRLLNRIATPFKKPLVIGTSGTDSKIVGSDVYYTPSGDKPIGMFIVDSDNTQQTISLTVIPEADIPGQNLIVKLEDLRTIENLAVTAGKEEEEVLQPRASDYTGYVRSLLTQAVRGKVQGFSPVPLEGGVALMGVLSVEPEVAFSGSAVDIYRYKLENTGHDPIDLVETAFFRKGVKAISFFPRMSLKPGEVSYVFLLADKPKSTADTGAGVDSK